ncbi:hypothetical protein ACP275_08G173500 [Erythranthe tilingii]
MASSSSSATSKAFNNMLLSALIAATMAAVLVSGFQYPVGEKMGWKKPTGKEPETYNEWAAKNRFHIGDTVNFKYQNDSVLVVSPVGYLTCNTTNPISRFDDGDTVFQFDRPGFFYFISGEPGHCKSGQRLIVRVMHPSQAPEVSPSPAPSPSGGSGRDGGGGSGSPGVSAAVKVTVVSCFVAAVVGLFVVYLFA